MNRQIYLNNRYGYKVGYYENRGRFFNRHFITTTYKQAVNIKHMYIRYPPLSRSDDHIIKKPKWAILPISRKEVRDGIWREVPF